MSDAEDLENTSNVPDSDDHKNQPRIPGVDSVDDPSISPNSIEGVFFRALQKTNPTDRESFLEEACSNDADRRRRVDALL